MIEKKEEPYDRWSHELRVGLNKLCAVQVSTDEWAKYQLPALRRYCSLYRPTTSRGGISFAARSCPCPSPTGTFSPQSPSLFAY